MEKKTIAIIGAGLAGLNCARLLDSEYNITIFDRNSKIGGRILTDHEQGFTLDHGFQVFLPDYPEARLAFDISKLDLVDFEAGALIKIGNKFHHFSDPMRNPKNIISTLVSPIGNIKDKLLILKLKRSVLMRDKSLHNISTKEYLKEFGFSQNIIDRFFTPFFSGIFLERELKTSAYFFSFLFSLFSKSNACVPKEGMMQLPLNIASQLENTIFKLSSEVTQINKQSVVINGTQQKFDIVICAFNEQTTQYNSVTTDYFSSPKTFPQSSTLYLNANKTGVINHIAPMRAYGTQSHNLWAVNTLRPQEKTPIQTIKEELVQWFPSQEFEHVKRFNIDKALPTTTYFGKDDILRDGVYFCGDQMQDASINGALKSGRIVAEHILKLSRVADKEIA